MSIEPPSGTPATPTVEQRLEQLQRQMRRQRRFLFLTALMLMLVSVVFAYRALFPSAVIMHTRALSVTDLEGHDRILIGLTNTGEAGLAVQDAEGRGLAYILGEKGGRSGVVLSDGKEDRCYLQVAPKCTAAEFREPSGKTRLRLGAWTDGAASVEANSKDDRYHARLYAEDSNAELAVAEVREGHYYHRLQMVDYVDRPATMQICNEWGEPKWVARPTSLAIFDPQTSNYIGLGLDYQSEPSLVAGRQSRHYWLTLSPDAQGLVDTHVRYWEGPFTTTAPASRPAPATAPTTAK